MTESDSTSDGARKIKSVSTACRIIDTLDEMNGARITDIVEELDLSKGSVHTHLSTLREHELVVKEGDTYRPSFRFLQIGERVRQNHDLISTAKPELNNLAEMTDNRAYLIVEEHGRAVITCASAGQDALATSGYAGRRGLLHCTASGKAILAYLPRSEVEDILDRHGLPQYTENTITDRDELFRELDQIREAGIAYARGEKIKGLHSIGAPILDENDSVIGSISITVPVNDLNSDTGDEFSQSVKKTANVIEVNHQILHSSDQ